MTLELTQAEADVLLKMEKIKIDNSPHDYPDTGESLKIPLTSPDEREKFFLDIRRGRIELQKNTFQTRARKTVALARIDMGGAPHRNPDGKEIGCPHLHLYREGYDTKWAIPLPKDFKAPDNFWETLQDFMEYCSIKEKPNIVRGLFT